MSGTTVCMTAKKNHTLDEILLHLQTDTSLEFVARHSAGTGDSPVVLAVFEMYFIRIGSYASVSILFSEDAQTRTAPIIACGGGESISNTHMGKNAEESQNRNSSAFFLTFWARRSAPAQSDPALPRPDDTPCTASPSYSHPPA